MQIHGPDHQDISEEIDVMTARLNFKGARVLELGCGAAEKTRQIAEQTEVAEIIAAEVDEIQHAKNLAIDDLDKVTFASFGAEAIDAPDDSFDIVLMFKSLHHVPMDLMDRALIEIKRVLKPAGVAYISEPVFAGDFNEVIRLFHDESTVRQAAFEAVARAVNDRVLDLQEEYFFKNVARLTPFRQFEKGILNATHTDHDLTVELRQQVKDRFESFRGEQGFVFEIPNRIDLLRKALV